MFFKILQLSNVSYFNFIYMYICYVQASLTFFSSYFWTREIIDYFSRPKIRRKTRY